MDASRTMKKFAATLVLLAVCTSIADAQTPAQSWDNIKAVTFPVLAPAFANDYDAPYRMPLSDYGWEDGPQISADGLDFYGLYAPMDLFSSTAYLINNPGLPFCDLLGNMDFLRPYAGLYGMDLVNNPFGCDSFLNIDILYAHRNSVQDSFQTWQPSGIGRAGMIEGGPAPMAALSDPNVLDMFIYTGNGDIWVIQNTTRNPSGIANAIRLPTPINPDSSEFTADNANLARLQGDSVLMVYEKYIDPGQREFNITMTTDKGSTWTPPIAVTTITNALGHLEHPCLYRDPSGQWWLYYSLDLAVIVRSRQLVPGDWDSWDAPEVILSKGNGIAIGEPSLSAAGDLTFVFGTENTVLNDSSDRLDLDPWLLPRKLGTGQATAQAAALDLQAFPNPSDGDVDLFVGMPRAARVHVGIYDALGQERAVVRMDAPRPAGTHVVHLPTAALPAGVYACRVTADGRTAVIKIVLR
jgi:hypothetical protein